MTVSNYRANALAVALCVLFVITGSVWIWRPGIQLDEALFTGAIFGPFEYPAACIRIFGRDYGTMVMTYVGGLKAQLWRPIFAAWQITPETIRLPALLLGAVSVWLFYRLLLRTLGIRTALAGTALLATDTTYLFTARWDWGPVVLQHILLLAGMLALVNHWQTKRLLWLAAGFFAFGLGVWDKALFVWNVVAMSAAALAAFPHHVWRSLNLRAVAVAVLAFAAGAYPLIRYNVKYNWVTFRSNTAWSTEGFRNKVDVLLGTLDSDAAGGPIVRDDDDAPQRQPHTAGERVVASVADMFGRPRRNLHAWLFLASLVSLPFLWKKRARPAILFSVVFIAAAWLQMAMVKGGGTSTHHTILLWPMPILAMAAALGGTLRSGRALGAVTAAVVAVNLVVTTSWYAALNRNGGTSPWTDAIYPASHALRTIPHDQACVVDWGLFDNIRALHQGRINLCVADDPADPERLEFALQQISDPGTLFIRHTPDEQVFPDWANNQERFAADEGFRKSDRRVFADSNGRQVIEIFRYERAK